MNVQFFIDFARRVLLLSGKLIGQCELLESVTIHLHFSNLDEEDEEFNAHRRDRISSFVLLLSESVNLVKINLSRNGIGFGCHDVLNPILDAIGAKTDVRDINLAANDIKSEDGETLVNQLPSSTEILRLGKYLYYV